MAVEYLRCLPCGRMGKVEELTADAPAPDPAHAVNMAVPGRRGREWRYGPVTLVQALALRRRLAAALERLDEEIRAAGG